MDDNRFNIFNLLLNDIISNEIYIPVMRNSPSQTVLNASLYDRNPIRHVITDEVKSTLNPIKFRDVNEIENNSKCSILCENFKEDDDVIQLPCNHCFFVEPIMKWLTEDSCECPVCRYKFESMEKKIQTENVVEPELEAGIENIFTHETLDQNNITNFINYMNMNMNFQNDVSYFNVDMYPPINLDFFEDELDQQEGNNDIEEID